MERYLQQFMDDILLARENIPEPWWHFVGQEEDREDLLLPWMEDIESAPRKSLEEWTGIKMIQIPPAGLLDERQVRRLLNALKEMLSAYNCHVVFQQKDVPEKVQYEIIRKRFDQEVPQLRANDYFFSFCDPDNDQSLCQLGKYCECRFFDHLLSNFDDLAEATVEGVNFEEYYLRRKYGCDWETYAYRNDRDEFDDDLPEEDDAEWGDEEDDAWP